MGTAWPKLAGITVMGLTLAGCAGGGGGGGGLDLGGLIGGDDREVRFRCDDDRSFRASFNGDRDRVTIEAGERTYRLRLADRDGDRRRYGGDEVRLVVDGDEAELRIEGRDDYEDCERA